jgi:hypothetical protein
MCCVLGPFVPPAREQVALQLSQHKSCVTADLLLLRASSRLGANRSSGSIDGRSDNTSRSSDDALWVYASILTL